jgi:hypothetical protein
MHPSGPVPAKILYLLPLSVPLDWPLNLSRESNHQLLCPIDSHFHLFLAFFLDISTLEDKEIMLSLNIRSLLPSDAVLYSKIMESSATPL